MNNIFNKYAGIDSYRFSYSFSLLEAIAISFTNVKKTSQKKKNDNYSYLKVGRTVTIWGAIETSPFLF